MVVVRKVVPLPGQLTLPLPVFDGPAGEIEASWVLLIVSYFDVKSLEELARHAGQNRPVLRVRALPSNNCKLFAWEGLDFIYTNFLRRLERNSQARDSYFCHVCL